MEQKNETPAVVDYYIYEGAMVRAERYFKRAIIALIVVIGLALLTVYLVNRAWMQHVENNYVPIERSVEATALNSE